MYESFESAYALGGQLSAVNAYTNDSIFDNNFKITKKNTNHMPLFFSIAF